MRARLEREARQFRRLVRLSFGRLLDAALGSREIAAEHVVIWTGALLAIPPLLYTVRTTSAYPFLRHRSLEALQSVALADRLFFIMWAMLVALLLVSLLWDALIPDRTDQQILGVLPVRARSVATARLVAALVAGLSFIAAVCLPPAIGYGLVSAVDPVLGSRLGIVVGQVLGTLGGGLFVFLAMLTIRGLLVFLVGAAAAARVAVLLQVATILLLVEAFLFLPGILPGVLRPLLVPGASPDTWLPPAWFLGLSVSIAGPKSAQLAPVAPYAVAAIGVAFVSAFVVYFVPAPWTARRAIEARTSARRGRLGGWATALASRLVVARPSRAMVAFTLRTMARSTRHQLVMATWIGLALAVGGVRLVSAQVQGRSLPLDQPFDYLVALPLVLTFFLVGGLRSAFALPADFLANWTFRLAAGQRPAPCLNAVRAAYWSLAVIPVSAAVILVGGSLWGLEPALAVAAMHAASGIFLCELVMLDCQAIPFTRQRGLTTSAIKFGAPLAVAGFIPYAFLLDNIQVFALARPWGVTTYVATGLTITTILAIAGGRRPRPPVPNFDAPSDEMTALRLSGATG